MRVNYRQAKRLVDRYLREGPKGLTHRHLGRSAPNARSPEVRTRILRLHQEVYSQLNDVQLVEMLEEREGLRIGRETARRWLCEGGIKPKRRRRPPKHFSRRPLQPQRGLLMLWDGSPHHWFGSQRPPCSLLHAIDDATGAVMGAVFRPQEDAIGYLRLLDMVLRRHGIPAAVYQDLNGALFRNDRHWSHEEELAGLRFPTHIGRIFQELGTETNPTFSPQGKGRIELKSGTFQDRLVAEITLEGVTDIDSSNAWLETFFLDRFNARFPKPLERSDSAFRKIPAAKRYQLVSFATEPP